MFASTYLHDDFGLVSDNESQGQGSANDSDILPRRPHINIARQELVKFSQALSDEESRSSVSKSSCCKTDATSSDDTWPGTLPGYICLSSFSTVSSKRSIPHSQVPVDWFDVAMLDGSPCFCLAGKAINPVPREDELPKKKILNRRYTHIPPRENPSNDQTVEVEYFVVDYKKKHELIRARWVLKPTRASLLRDRSLGLKYKRSQKTVTVKNSCTQTDSDVRAIMRKYANLDKSYNWKHETDG